MPNKKAAEPSPSPEEQALEHRVEVLMNPKQPDETPTPVVPPKTVSTPPALDIFKGLPGDKLVALKSAPAVPSKLLKTIEPQPLDGPADKPVEAAKPAPAVEPAADSQPPETIKPAAELDAPETDKAVDAIVASEGDQILAAEDAAVKEANTVTKAPSWKSRLARPFKNKWTWVGIAIVLIGIFALPFTRYKVLGLVIKEPVSVTVTDSKTGTPVSNASVSLDGKSAKTNGTGIVLLKVPLGKATLQVTKQYFKTYTQSYSVGFKSGKSESVHLLATGRQVPLTVVNTITGKPLANAEVAVLDTTAKTNAKGQAIIVLPTTAVSDSATVSLAGYNSTQANIQVTSSVVSGNTIKLTPAGHLYFLSNLSGTIDVVKSNLDGSDRQTVLAGNSNEDPEDVSLLASRDWRYLVLKSQRDSRSQVALYLIDTSTDKITQFDNADASNASFGPIGWYGHYFMYDVVRNAASASQNGHEVIKSYDADNGQLNLLDQNQAQGGATSYASQSFSNFYILDNLLVYNTEWYPYSTSGASYDLSSLNDTIRGVQPNGQGKKDYQSFAAAGFGYVQAALYQPQAIYYAVYSSSDNNTTYYNFENGSVGTIASLPAIDFNQPYPTYLVSPSGSLTFWTELRDAKNTLFIGDRNAAAPKQIATPSDYSPYGWYSDDYVLVSKNSNEIYIMPASGLSGVESPLKVSDYYKPAPGYYHYGNGYGYGSL